MINGRGRKKNTVLFSFFDSNIMLCCEILDNLTSLSLQPLLNKTIGKFSSEISLQEPQTTHKYARLDHFQI